LRACLESEALADELLPGLAAEGAITSLPTSNIFGAILAARGRGEKPDLPKLEESLTPAEQRLAYDCQFADAEPLSREAAVRCCQALHRKKLERERDAIQTAIRVAEAAGDGGRLAELLRTKSKLASQLAQRGSP